MPQRFLRPGIRNSDRWNKVSFGAQSLYVRLLTLVDDFGRYDGRDSVIHGDCWSVWNELHPSDVVNPQRSAAFRSELQAENLIEIYETDGKKVLQLLQWQERARSETSKWPDKRSVPQESAAERSVPQRNPASLGPRSSVLAITSSPPPSGNGVGEKIQFLRKALNTLMKREDNIRWSELEEHTLVDVCRRRPDVVKEMGEVVKYFEVSPKWVPNSISRLLETWDAVIDRARNPRPESEPVKLWEQERALQELINNHPANRNSVNSNGTPTKDQTVEFGQLKKKLAEVKAKIANGGK